VRPVKAQLLHRRHFKPESNLDANRGQLDVSDKSSKKECLPAAVHKTVGGRKVRAFEGHEPREPSLPEMYNIPHHIIHRMSFNSMHFVLVLHVPLQCWRACITTEESKGMQLPVSFQHCPEPTPYPRSAPGPSDQVRDTELPLRRTQRPWARIGLGNAWYGGQPDCRVPPGAP